MYDTLTSFCSKNGITVTTTLGYVTGSMDKVFNPPRYGIRLLLVATDGHIYDVFRDVVVWDDETISKSLDALALYVAGTMRDQYPQLLEELIKI